jgi:hypothetical protein
VRACYTSGMYTKMRVAKSGNLVETTYGDLGKTWHRVVMDTRGMGDRRARKKVAREELQRRTGDRVYAVYHYGAMDFLAGVITRFSDTFTIKVD